MRRGSIATSARLEWGVVLVGKDTMTFKSNAVRRQCTKFIRIALIRRIHRHLRIFEHTIIFSSPMVLVSTNGNGPPHVSLRAARQHPFLPQFAGRLCCQTQLMGHLLGRHDPQSRLSLKLARLARIHLAIGDLLMHTKDAELRPSPVIYCFP